MRTLKASILLGVTLLVLSPLSAWAHGERTISDPEDGARVEDVPSVISIDFSEPPTKDGRFTVLDGCGNDVLSEVTGEGSNKKLQIAGGSPGRWEAIYTVISSTDGHESHDRIRFTVAGKKDCGEPSTDSSPDISDGASSGGSDDASTFPLVPLLIGGAAILVLAVGARIMSSR